MILDTNGLSALADGEPKLQPVFAAASELAIPVIALGEFRYGIAQSRDRALRLATGGPKFVAKRRARYEKWLKELVGACRVLDVDEQTANEYAAIRGELRRGGSPIPGNDAWIAALARQYGLPVLSRDHHFDLVPKVKRISW